MWRRKKRGDRASKKRRKSRWRNQGLRGQLGQISWEIFFTVANHVFYFGGQTRRGFD